MKWGHISYVHCLKSDFQTSGWGFIWFFCPKSSINQAHIYSPPHWGVAATQKIQYDPSWTLLTWFSYRVCVSVYLCTFSDNFGGLNFKKSSFSANFLVGHSRDLSIHSRYSIGEACVCTSIIGNWQGTLIESTNFVKSWSSY